MMALASGAGASRADPSPRALSARDTLCSVEPALLRAVEYGSVRIEPAVLRLHRANNALSNPPARRLQRRAVRAQEGQSCAKVSRNRSGEGHSMKTHRAVLGSLAMLGFAGCASAIALDDRAADSDAGLDDVAAPFDSRVDAGDENTRDVPRLDVTDENINPTCYAGGTYCNWDRQCCTGSCVLSFGTSGGLCTPLGDAAVDACALRHNGSVCQGASDCCSGSCVPYGSGVSECAPP